MVAVAVGAYDVFKNAGLKADYRGHRWRDRRLHAAGALDRDTAFNLVRHRATAMAEAAKMAKGQAMAAVIGPGASELGGGDVWLANLNEPGQVVISGTDAAVGAESAKLQAKGFRVVPPRSGRFHTPLMAPAGNAFGAKAQAAARRSSRRRAPRCSRT